MRLDPARFGVLREVLSTQRGLEVYPAFGDAAEAVEEASLEAADRMNRRELVVDQLGAIDHGSVGVRQPHEGSVARRPNGGGVCLTFAMTGAQTASEAPLFVRPVHRRVRRS